MVRRVLLIGLLAVGLLGCGDKLDQNAQKTEALTPEQQIENIRKTEGMPDDVKARTIAGIQAQIDAKKAAAPGG